VPLPLMKVVPLAVRLPLTEVVAPYNVTWSPVVKFTLPASESAVDSTTLAPVPALSVPAAPTVTGPPNVELPVPRAIDPSPKLRVVREFVVTLKTESAVFVECVTVPLPVRSITTALEGPGTFPPTQFPGVSQSPPVGAVVVFHMIVERTIRFSRPSMTGLIIMVRFRAARRCRELDSSMILRRGERDIDDDPNSSERCEAV
jgi:hypothetical protein